MKELGNDEHADAFGAAHWRRRKRRQQSLGGSCDIVCDRSTDGGSGGRGGGHKLTNYLSVRSPLLV